MHFHVLVLEEGGDSWMYSLRVSDLPDLKSALLYETENINIFCFSVLQPCTETLYLTLMKDYWRTIGPVVVSLVTELDSSPTNVEDLQNVLVKDAGSFAGYFPSKLWF